MTALTIHIDCCCYLCIVVVHCWSAAVTLTNSTLLELQCSTGAHRSPA